MVTIQFVTNVGPSAVEQNIDGWAAMLGQWGWLLYWVRDAQFALIAILVLSLIALVANALGVFGNDGGHKVLPKALTLQSVNLDRQGSTEYLRLQVENPYATPIHGCFVELTGSRNSAKDAMPPTGLRFPRSTRTGGGDVFTIPGHHHATVDIAMFDRANDPNRFYFLQKPTWGDELRKVEFSYPTDAAQCELFLRAGSESVSIPPRDVRLTVRFDPTSGLSGDVH